MRPLPPLGHGDGQHVPAADTREEIRKAAAGIEEALLRTMLQSMTKAQLQSGGFFGEGSAEGTEQTTFEMVLTETLAKASPLGIADRLADQLARGRGSVVSARDAAAMDATELAFRAGSNAPAPQVGGGRSVQEIHTGASRSRNPVR